MSERVADWSHLPLELLEKIAGTLDEIADRVRFAAVCKPWRSVSRSPHLPPIVLPWLLLESRNIYSDSFFYGNNEDDGVRSVLSLSDHKTYDLSLPATRYRVHFGSAYGWLLVYDEIDSLLLLLNPINGSQISLPPVPLHGHTVDHFKLIRSPEKFVVMVAMMSNCLIYCLQLREGVDIAAATWSKIQVRGLTCRLTYRTDYTYHDGHYFVLGKYGKRTFVVDADTCLVIAVVPSVARGVPFSVCRREDIPYHGQYFANSPNGDDLFLVISPSRNRKNWSVFEVFKLDRAEEHPTEWTWSEVRDIGCNVVFLDQISKSAMVLPASGFGGLRGNCIVFYCRRQEEGFRFSLFDIGNDRIEQLAGSWDAKLNVWKNHGWFVPSLQVN